MNILLAGSLKCREHIVAVETYNRNSVKGPYTHMCQGLLHIRQTLDCTTAGSARTATSMHLLSFRKRFAKGSIRRTLSMSALKHSVMLPPYSYPSRPVSIHISENP